MKKAGADSMGRNQREGGGQMKDRLLILLMLVLLLVGVLAGCSP